MSLSPLDIFPRSEFVVFVGIDIDKHHYQTENHADRN